MESIEKIKFWEFNWVKYVLEDVECTKCWRIKENSWACDRFWGAPNTYWEQCCWRAMFLKTNRYREAFNW